MKKKVLLILFVSILSIGSIVINMTHATSSYIYEKTVDGIETLTICDPNDTTACITMQDRNLWATTNDITSDKSYWYHFQWWNNHGFKPWKVNTIDHVVFPNWESIWSSQMDCSSYGPWNPLDRDIFMAWESDYFNSEFDYCDSHNDNLWWGGNDYYETNRWYDTETHLVDNVKWRQWPCQNWYHIPSNWEWHELLEIWTKNYWNWLSVRHAHLVKQINTNYNGAEQAAAAASQFREDFKIPLAGYRDRYKAYVGGMGHDANLWSSSAYIGYNVVHYRYVGPNSIAAGSTAPYANAYSIRCFKDVPITLKSNTSGKSTENSTLSDSDNSVNNNSKTSNKYYLCNKYQNSDKKIFSRMSFDKINFLNELKCIYWK